ncbi:MAG: pyruvate dehydrogenase (acetyl-transferring) E1 component subunit alpha [Gemmatimonadota bacterium]
MATRSKERTVLENEFLGLSRDAVVDLLRQMLRMRRFEGKTAESYQLGEIGGFCHLYLGQEAVGAGAISALRPDDYVITAYRDHGQALARGMDPKAILAELFGKRTGTSKGMGGSMHLFDAKTNFLGGHAIVGGQVPMAAGVAYAIRYRDGDQVILCFLGDAAVNQGVFLESLNMAGLWGLPVLYLIENNLYGMGTAVRRAAAVEPLSKRACIADDVLGATFDGQDVIAVRGAVDRAITRAREEKRPSVLEAICYRYMGHSMADAAYGTYRNKDEVTEWQRERDPIHRFVERLKKAELIEDEEVDRIDKEARAEIEEALEFARSSEPPGPESLYEDIYADPYPDLRRRDPWR